jgi:hypothetical protein
MHTPKNIPWHGRIRQTVRQLSGHWPVLLAAAVLSLVFLGILAEVASAIEVALPKKEELVYGDFPVVGRRVAMWVIAQLHLMFGAFVVHSDH